MSCQNSVNTPSNYVHGWKDGWLDGWIDGRMGSWAVQINIMFLFKLYLL